MWHFLDPLLPLLTAEGQPGKQRQLWEKLHKQLKPVQRSLMQKITLFLDHPSLNDRALLLGQQSPLAAWDCVLAEARTDAAARAAARSRQGATAQAPVHTDADTNADADAAMEDSVAAQFADTAAVQCSTPLGAGQPSSSAPCAQAGQEPGELGAQPAHQGAFPLSVCLLSL
jgi:hypothetical protein